MNLRQAVDLVLLGAIWGASFLFMRVAAPEFGAASLVLLRVSIAAALLLPILIVRQGTKSLRGHFGWLFVLGVVNSAIPFFLFAYAASQVTAGYSAILNATAPLWGALVAAVWLGDRLTRTAIFGLLLGFTGVVILVAGRASFAPGGALPAIAACLGATLCYGIGVNMVKRFLPGVNPLATATGSLVAAAFVLTPFGVARWPSAAVSRGSWLAVIALAVLCTGIALILYFRLIRGLGPARAITVTYLIPVFGMIWGWLALGEPITVAMLAGTLVILFGVALTTGALKQIGVYVSGRSTAEPQFESIRPGSSGTETRASLNSKLK
jgi:drug/metabolite transporter (DMT)-like permease